MIRANCEDLRLCPGLGFSQICGGKYKIRILWVLTKRSYRYGEIRVSMAKGPYCERSSGGGSRAPMRRFSACGRRRGPDTAREGLCENKQGTLQ